MLKKRKGFGFAIAAILALLIFSALRVPYLEMPLDRDEGTYLVLGKHVTEGKTPYSDVYEMKPPGLFYSYALLTGFGVYSYKTARLSTLIIYGVIGLLLFLILYRKGWRWGALTGQLVFYSLSMNPYVHGYALLPEPIMLFFFLLGILCLGQAKRNVANILLGGFFLGWSFWIKQNMVFPLIFIGLWAVFGLWRRQKISVKQVGWALLGFSLGPILTTIWVFLSGGGSDMIYWMWTYPAKVYTQSISVAKGSDFLLNFLRLSGPISILWAALAVAGFIAHFYLKKNVWGRATPILFALFSLLAVSPGLRFYGHYWILVLPSIALGVGVLFEFLNEKVKSILSERYSNVFMVTLVFAVFTFHLWNHQNVYLSPKVENWSRRSYGNNPFLEIKDIASKLKTYGDGNEKVVVMGSEPQIYVYLQQTPFTPHTFITFLNKRHPRRGKMRADFTSDVQTEKPAYLIFVNHPYSWSITEGDHQDVYQWALRYAKNQYRPIALYEMDGRPNDRRIWSADPGNVQPTANSYIQVYKKRKGG